MNGNDEEMIPTVDDAEPPCKCGQCAELWAMGTEQREFVVALWMMERYDR
jgi:hypothetical protein